jgi:hypothetical protein
VPRCPTTDSERHQVTRRRADARSGAKPLSGLRVRVLVLAGILALAFTGVLGRLRLAAGGPATASWPRIAERQYSRT